jgi:hypothetical protein
MTKTKARRPLPVAQWLAARAIAEGEPPTRKLIAQVLGCNETTLYERAALEGWKRLDFRRHDVKEAHRMFVAVALEEYGGGEGGGASSEGRAAGVGGAGIDAHGDAQDADGVSVTDADRADADRDDGNAADEDPVAVLARCASFVARRVDALIVLADDGRRIPKTEIDTLGAMMRMMERWEAIAAERTKQAEVQSDEDLAAVLERIDDRIVALAEELAGQLVARRAVA